MREGNVNHSAYLSEQVCGMRTTAKRRCRMVVLLSKPLLVLVLIREACGEKCKSGLDTGKRNGASMHHWERKEGSSLGWVSERDIEIGREVSPLTGLQPVEGDRDVAALAALG